MAQFYNNVEQNPEFPKNLSESPAMIHPDSPASDCESGVTGGSSSSSAATAASPPPLPRRFPGIFDETLAVQFSPNDRTFDLIQRRFISAVTTVITTANNGVNVNDDINVNVVAIHRRNWSYDVPAQARVQSFQCHLRAMQYKLNNGVDNSVDNGDIFASPMIKFAWFGGSKSNIQQVLSRGFTFSDLNDNPNAAIFLSPDHSPAFSLEKSVEDEDGVRHLLLCRVLLGRSELIGPDSAQTEPSSEEFDSGVDDFDHPKKFIIWSTNMNSHILPEYVISFTIQSPPSSVTKGYAKERNVMRMAVPSSPWISFPALIAVLSKRLPSDAIALITKHHKEYKERRISRPELIKIVRQIAGDRLLIAVIKSCKGAREHRIPFGFLRNRNANK